MTNYAEKVDDLYEQIEREIQQEESKAKAEGHDDPAAKFYIEPASDAPSKVAAGGDAKIEYPFGIKVTSSTLHLKDNAKVFTMTTLDMWELVPPGDRKEYRRIKVVGDLARMMTGQVLIPWRQRQRRRLNDWLVELQLSGGYSCHVATNSYETNFGHDIVAITLLVRRLSAKEEITGKDEMKAIAGTIVCLMNDPVKDLSDEDKFLLEFIEAANANADDAERPQSADKRAEPPPHSDALIPRAPNATESLDRDGVFVNFFLEVKPISYEVEARSLGDIK